MKARVDEGPKDQFSGQVPLSVWEMLDEEYWKLRGYEDPKEGRLQDANSEDPEKKMYGELWLKYMTAKEASNGERTAALDEAEKTFRDCLCRRLASEPRSALCFSGGGIRSATFGLGVLQGLARHSCDPEHPELPPKLLPQFNYLSTVSGGGYLGGWFSAWMKHKGRDDVIRELAARSISKLDPEPRPLLHLRSFSNYLNPRLGILSADTWTLVATVMRNMLLNWLVLLPLVALVLLVPQLVLDLARLQNVPIWSAWLVAGLSFVLGTMSFAYVILELPGRQKANHSQRAFLWKCLVPLSLCVLGLPLSWCWLAAEKGQSYITVRDFMIFVAALLGAGALLGISPILSTPEPAAEAKAGTTRGRIKLWAVPIIVLAGAVVAAVTGWLIYLLFNALFDRTDLRAYSVFAGSGVMAIVIFTQALLVGFVSWITGDEDREWWARAGAWVYIVALAWTAAAGLVLYTSPLFEGLRWLAAAILSSASLGGIASALGLSSKTSATGVKIPFAALSKSQVAAQMAVPITLTGFLVLLVISVAAINNRLLGAMKLGIGGHFVLAAIFLAAAFLLSLPINVNRFSLHAMYRNRLIRAFLGASNTCRDPNRFTGFDPNDNCSMHDLRYPPLHIVNMALNLLEGDNLAWQQRKAESFTASPLHAGSMRVGYQRSQDYAKSRKMDVTDNGITLGGAMAISGAAASPNMGYHSSPLMTMVMTLFNARLGAWLANPGKAGEKHWDDPGPAFALLPFVYEAFGMTTDHDRWVYLSDGGHFENLGLYEMVLRRCHYIVAVDASADPDYQYEDLANAIRKIRVDLGVTINFPSRLPFSSEGTTGKHFAIGTIDYSHVDGKSEPGMLLYIKPSLNGNEPTDVTNYHSKYKSFPHQTTADQWFDESQFESYRCLGTHIVDEILKDKDVREFFRKAAGEAKPTFLDAALGALTK